MGRIAVLGPGGVGGLLAAALARAGDEAVLVAREETAELITRDGVHVESVRLGAFSARPAAVARLDEEVDALIVAVKATALAAALERVCAAPPLVVPLLNGIDHVAELRARFGAGAVAGTIRVEAHRPRPGVVVHTSPFLRVELASDAPAPRPALAALGKRLTAAGIPAEVRAPEAQVLWSKLVRLNALALTTSAADRPLGWIREDPEWRGALTRCVEEASAVAGAEGAEIRPDAVMVELADAHAGLGSSMQRDLAAGREPELDAIAGAVLRAAARGRLSTPTVARLAARVAARAGLPWPGS